jgi:hypothetical protein
LALNDTAGNSFTNVVATATLDQDIGEQAALKLTVNSGNPIGAATASAVPFTVAGLQADDNGTVSFSDGSHAPVVVNIVNGAVSSTTVNLSGLNDGAITATLQLNSDAAGNAFTSVVTTATLDQDILPETPSLSAPSALSFTGSANLGIVVSALDSDDKLKVAISGVPSFETITAAGATATVTHQGSLSTYTFNSLPAADWNNGLVVNSTLTSGHPTNVLTVQVSNTTTGETSATVSTTISVTDPPASVDNGLQGTGSLVSGTYHHGNSTLADCATPQNTGGAPAVSNGVIDQALALFGQYMASSFVTASDGHGGTLITDPPPDQQRHLSIPHA